MAERRAAERIAVRNSLNLDMRNHISQTGLWLHAFSGATAWLFYKRYRNARADLAPRSMDETEPERWNFVRC
jgi:hypothetical protein